MLLISLKLHAMVDLLTKRISVRSLYGINYSGGSKNFEKKGRRKTISSICQPFRIFIKVHVVFVDQTLNL